MTLPKIHWVALGAAGAAVVSGAASLVSANLNSRGATESLGAPASPGDVETALAARAATHSRVAASGLMLGGEVTDVTGQYLLELADGSGATDARIADVRAALQDAIADTPNIPVEFDLNWSGYHEWTIHEAPADSERLAELVDEMSAAVAEDVIVEVHSGRTAVSTSEVRFDVTAPTTVQHWDVGRMHRLLATDPVFLSPAAYFGTGGEFAQASVFWSEASQGWNVIRSDSRYPGDFVQSHVTSDGIETSYERTKSGFMSEARRVFVDPETRRPIAALTVDFLEMGTMVEWREYSEFGPRASLPPVVASDWLPLYHFTSEWEVLEGDLRTRVARIVGPDYLIGCGGTKECRARAVEEILARLGTNDRDVDFDGDGVVGPDDIAWVRRHVGNEPDAP